MGRDSNVGGAWKCVRGSCYEERVWEGRMSWTEGMGKGPAMKRWYGSDLNYEGGCESCEGCGRECGRG